MRVAVFSTKSYDRAYLDTANASIKAPHQLFFLEPKLTAQTAALAEGAEAICAFVNDRLDRSCLNILAAGGTKLVALRSAGFNHVDLKAADELGLIVARVPAYSPHAVAEHCIALMLSLNRKIHRAYARVREGNFALEGLLGFDLRKRTVGIVGTGQIGMAVAQILTGFGCRILASDPAPDPEFEILGGQYVSLAHLLGEADIITLHCPLSPATRHMINGEAIDAVKPGVMLINTSRGAVIDTKAVIAGLKSGKIGYLGLDVYEEEEGLFFEDMSDKMIQDDLFARLLTFPNVLITGHQGFFTHEALTAIAAATIENLSCFEQTGHAVHQVAMVAETEGPAPRLRSTFKQA